MTPDTNTQGLLPCPFCGGDPEEVPQSKAAFSFVIWCEACGADGPEHGCEADAIAAWNTRPHSPTKGAEPVGEAGSMPGTDGFTMAAFKASDVPIGTKLYAAPRSPDSAASDTGAGDGQPTRYHLTEPTVEIDGVMLGKGWLLMTEAEYASLIAPPPTAADAGKGGVVEALEEARNWHESRDKALSKQPPSSDISWRRMEHQEERDRINQAVAALQADTPAQVGKVDPATMGDVSSLIAARCSALPGKLIDCPVCGAVDAERKRLAAAEGGE